MALNGTSCYSRREKMTNLGPEVYGHLISNTMTIISEQNPILWTERRRAVMFEQPSKLTKRPCLKRRPQMTEGRMTTRQRYQNTA